LPAPRPEWAYFFDIDGTLVELEDSAAGTGADADLQRLIAELSGAAGGAIALISGRSIADIDRLVRDHRLPVAGQHGLERRDAAGRISRHAVPAQGLDGARSQLAAAVARHHGLVLEDKGLSLALHYRRAPRLGGYAHRLIRSLAARLGSQNCVRSEEHTSELQSLAYLVCR